MANLKDPESQKILQGECEFFGFFQEDEIVPDELPGDDLSPIHEQREQKDQKNR